MFKLPISEASFVDSKCWSFCWLLVLFTMIRGWDQTFFLSKSKETRLNWGGCIWFPYHARIFVIKGDINLQLWYFDVTSSLTTGRSKCDLPKIFCDQQSWHRGDAIDRIRCQLMKLKLGASFDQCQLSKVWENIVYSRLGHVHLELIWWFPKIGVPPNHPFIDGW